VCALLGFDFMLAASGRPFLIECNANPLIAGQNPWHEQLVSRMVDDYVTLAADEAFFASDAARAPLPRPPLDGSHVQEWGDHSGFELIVGRPTEAHTQPLYGVATADNNMLVLQRAESERQKAAAVDEPQPPPVSPALLPPAAVAGSSIRYTSRIPTRGVVRNPVLNSSHCV